MCLKRGLPARPARGPCQETHGVNITYASGNLYTTSNTSFTVDNGTNSYSTADITSTTGGSTWVTW